eukprot:CAMPEP_0198287366 /NCGR_PEP_ID=MMETSP1449-20131203/6213_1 /TAXON_ID=420275 /ORGANISM="Attheya septentrionalis, Strain CCMP2084" /LENGTH=141 /DNA_ID=CAMNT_0043985313 /DNA_START=188 /DNA_END=610 /DNA_ORIENTATION=-
MVDDDSPPPSSGLDLSSTKDNEDDPFVWAPLYVAQAVAVFCLAGVAEILGGWMVWVAVRGQPKRPWWYALIGSIILVLYGFIPCLQPTDSFGRIYAVYGGFFIVLSLLFGWALDGDRPDLGDTIGCIISLIGVLLIMFWPR